MDSRKSSYIRPLVFLFGIIGLAACSAGPDPAADTLPTRYVLPSVTPSAAVTPNQENNPPLAVATLPADVVLVSPTLPPSKTPSATPTVTQSPIPPIPTIPTAVTATRTVMLMPTRMNATLTAPVPQIVDVVCETEWFFLGPDMEHCPVAEPTVSQAVFQYFEHGMMIWVEQQDAIYVLYNSFEQPAWEVYPDEFEEWMPETDSDWTPAPFPYTFQPRRGFGTLWRANVAVRERIGWAVDRFEWPFSSNIQTAEDGTIYIEGSEGGLVVLSPNQDDWRRVRPLESFLD